MSLRAGAAVVVVALTATTALAGTAEAWPRFVEPYTAQICVERPENNGALNVRPSNVVIDGGPSLTLLGGQAACAYVAGDRNYTVWVQSDNPYNPASTDTKAWRSTDLEVHVKPGSRLELVVCGKVVDGAYTNWQLQNGKSPCK